MRKIRISCFLKTNMTLDFYTLMTEVLVFNPAVNCTHQLCRLVSDSSRASPHVNRNPPNLNNHRFPVNKWLFCRYLTDGPVRWILPINIHAHQAGIEHRIFRLQTRRVRQAIMDQVMATWLKCQVSPYLSNHLGLCASI